MTPRLPPVLNPHPDAADTLAKALDHDGRPHNAALTLAYNPRLLRRFAVLAGYFLTHARIARRDVELITLRTAFRVKSEYYFGHHILLGRAAGLTDSEIRAAAGIGNLDARDATLVEVTDEMIATGDLCDHSWDALAALYADDLILEVIMLVGFYQMVGSYAKTMRLELEPGVPGWEFLDQ
jgi:alkylhydroperoxidase family enzyme